MSIYESLYIKNIKKYVEESTPLDFLFSEDKFNEIHHQLSTLKISEDEKLVVISCYALLYTAINYHLMIIECPKYKSYYILVGDFISSYVLELLYEKKLFKLKYIFINNTKKIILNIVNKKYEDTLLVDIMNYYKGC